MMRAYAYIYIATLNIRSGADVYSIADGRRGRVGPFSIAHVYFAIGRGPEVRLLVMMVLAYNG